MLNGIFTIIAIFTGIAAGGALGLYAVHLLRHSKHRRGFAVASALMMAFAFYNPKAEQIVETGERIKRKKDALSGDPPGPLDKDPPPARSPAP